MQYIDIWIFGYLDIWKFGYLEILIYLIIGLGIAGGTTGVATALATGLFRAFLTAPGFFAGRSSELESESESE